MKSWLKGSAPVGNDIIWISGSSLRVSCWKQSKAVGLVQFADHSVCSLCTKWVKGVWVSAGGFDTICAPQTQHKQHQNCHRPWYLRQRLHTGHGGLGVGGNCCQKRLDRSAAHQLLHTSSWWDVSEEKPTHFQRSYSVGCEWTSRFSKLPHGKIGTRWLLV